jgi:hypothetical protein
MAHTYATLGEFNDYVTSGGSTKFASETAAVVALKLSLLETASRRIEAACHRSSFGSGFGPRIGINYYDGDGCNELMLRDDLQSLSAFTVAPATGAAGVSPVVTTDYFLAGYPEGYTSPYRKIVLHQMGSPQVFAAGYRTIVATGTWGYPTTLVGTGTTVASGLSVGTTATTFTTSATPLISPGMTLRIESEDLYLTGLSGTTATVVRGANGTTAATHADGTAITRHQYDARVHDVCLRIAMRRWKARDAGADGSDGGLDIPGVNIREGEDTIIRRGLTDLILLGTY